MSRQNLGPATFVVVRAALLIFVLASGWVGAKLLGDGLGVL
jgi:hypothetical protein